MLTLTISVRHLNSPRCKAVIHSLICAWGHCTNLPGMPGTAVSHMKLSLPCFGSHLTEIHDGFEDMIGIGVTVMGEIY